RAHADRLAVAGHPGAHPADPTDDEVDGDAGLRGAVQLVDDILVDDRVHLEADAGRAALPSALRLLADELDEALAEVEGRDEEALELLLDRVAGQLVEEPGQVLADLLIGGEDA